MKESFYCPILGCEHVVIKQNKCYCSLAGKGRNGILCLNVKSCPAGYTQNEAEEFMKHKVSQKPEVEILIILTENGNELSENLV